MHSIGIYQFTNFLGSGSFGGVWECRNMTTNEAYACKIIDIETCLKDNYLTHFKNELFIHSRIRHPGITQIRDILMDQNNVYIILELCNGGNMNAIVQSQGGLSEDHPQLYFHQVMSAISYIHKLKVAHRDIKLENILITSDGHAKLTDFGLCKLANGDSPMMTTCGTLVYAAPEIIKEVPYNGMKADIWSAGVVLYAMVACHFPWAIEEDLPQEQMMQETAHQILEGDIEMPDEFSFELQNLISNMLYVNPENRYGAEEVLHHPWLRGIDEENAGSTEPDPNIISLVDNLIHVLESKKGTAASA